MGLYCPACLNEVPEGFGQCVACKAGFVQQLACCICRAAVPRGQNSCPACDRQARQAHAQIPQIPQIPPSIPSPLPPSIPSPLPPVRSFSSSPPSSSTELTYQSRSQAISAPRLPAFSGPGALVIPEEYEAGKLGVSATVQIPAAHAAVMNDMGQLVSLLHAMATKLVTLPGDGARHLARSMRMLATDIQDEIERRVGPQG